MTYTVATIDRTTLPAALLALAKSQMRVAHTRDDAFITDQVAQAIDDIERQTNATFFERVIALAPDGIWGTWWDEACCAAPGDALLLVKLPFNNVSALVVLDSDGVDVSLAYVVLQTDPGGVGSCVLQAPALVPGPPGYTFTFTAGCATPDELSPSVRRAILRRAAALYEYREAPEGLAEPQEAGAPLLWRPDA